jgi:hypothetical protein
MATGGATKGGRDAVKRIVVDACNRWALVAGAADAKVQNFRAHLAGKQEVPPVATRAEGQVIFQLSADGLSLRYQLNVANINDITMAHIHLAPAGQNGGVVAWLYPSEPPGVLIPGRFQGVLAAGVILGDDLVGSLAGQPLSALIDAIKAGGTYVNVHTVANGGGEIRGQIR